MIFVNLNFINSHEIKASMTQDWKLKLCRIHLHVKVEWFFLLRIPCHVEKLDVKNFLRISNMTALSLWLDGYNTVLIIHPKSIYFNFFVRIDDAPIPKFNFYMSVHCDCRRQCSCCFWTVCGSWPSSSQPASSTRKPSWRPCGTPPSSASLIHSSSTMTTRESRSVRTKKI